MAGGALQPAGDEENFVVGLGAATLWNLDLDGAQRGVRNFVR